MAVTLSHQSALDATRLMRAEGSNIHEMNALRLSDPSPWVGKRLDTKNFDSSVWRWGRPTKTRPLHILVPSRRSRIRGKGIVAHAARRDMPAQSTLWLDDNSSMVCPELLFLQMANSLSLPALVMLGLELCGHFTRQPDDPLMGEVVDGLPAATDADSLANYLDGFKGAKGLSRARNAVAYVRDHAMSAPEAVLATMYELPPEEGGYGLGPVRLNERVQVNDADELTRNRYRYPDLMLELAPVGLNYDGGKHFDIPNLMALAEALSRAEGKEEGEASEALRDELIATRSKVLDDNLRDRQLAAQGRIVFSATKEDLSDGKHLDDLTRQILSCAHNVFGADVDEHLRMLEDTSLEHDRWNVLDSLTPNRGLGTRSYGEL